MIENKIYRDALEKTVPYIAIGNGSVLVTGASGLIGSCLIDLLLCANKYGRNFEIYALGRSKYKLNARFKAFVESGNLHYIEQDIREPLDGSINYDYIIHGASNADPKSYALYPVETMLINIVGTKNILEYCRSHPQTRVILLSTFEVYANAGKDVYSEADYGILDLNILRNCYPESKRCAEQLLRCYVDEYKVNAVIGRLCSIYGPTMVKGDSKAHSQFIRNAFKGENIVLKSKGEQRRTYCYVIDAVTGLLFILAKGISGEAYNISYENSIASIADVAETVFKIAGTSVVFDLPDEIELKGFSSTQNCILDNKKLRNLGWHGSYSLGEGLTETLRIMKSNIL